MHPMRAPIFAIVTILASVPAAPAEAAEVAKACTRSCATALRECRAAVRESGAVLQGVCTAGSGDRRACRRAARRDARAAARACGVLRKQCRACCRAGGTSCAETRVTLDDPRAATAVVPPAGGTLTTTAADGTVFTLDIPAGALTAAETITLTPVTAFGPFPVGRGIVAAVHAEPSGLQLTRPATLTIALPQPPAERLLGLSYEGTGEDLRTTPLVVSGATATMPVTHFSGFGAQGSAPEVRAIQALATSAASQLFMDEFLALANQGVTDPAAYIDLMRRWYRELIRPGLQGAVGSDPRLRRALKDFDQWVLGVQDGPLALGLSFDLTAPLAAEQAEALALIATALRDAIARANARCLAEHRLAAAETALEWQVVAEAADIDTAANALDLDTVLDGLCLEATYEDVTFPAPPPLTIPSLLRVIVGLVFIDGVEATGDRMGVRVTPQGATVAGAAIGDTDAADTVEFEFTPAGDRELRLDIRACGNVPGQRRLNRVCQDGFVVRGLEVQPAQVTLASGGTQQFQALLFGQPTTAVSWSTDGGTVDAAGNFTAGATPGAFEVRATSTVDGHSNAAAVAVSGATTTSTTVSTTTTSTATTIPCHPQQCVFTGTFTTTPARPGKGTCASENSGRVDCHSHPNFFATGVDPNTGQLLGEIVFFFNCEVVDAILSATEFVKFGSAPTSTMLFGACRARSVVPVTVNLSARMR